MAVTVRPVAESDLQAVGEFLRAQWPRGEQPVDSWIRSVSAPWQEDAPNHGFMLVDNGSVVGVYLAVYSVRMIAGRRQRFCNLATWYVEPGYRLHSLRLLKALLAQDGYHFTDLSPSVDVVRINEKFRFDRLDTTFALVPNLPYPSVPARTTVTSDPRAIERSLSGSALRVYLDHAQAENVHHFALVRGADACHVMVRRHRIRGIKYFASVLHVSDPTLFRKAARHLARHLLVRWRALATLVELRLIDARPVPSLVMTMNSNRKMYRSPSLGPDHIDYLYSELTWSGA